MTTNFYYFSFAIFQGCSMTQFTEALYITCAESIRQGAAIVYNDQLNIQQYFNPRPGGAHYEKFSWWSSTKYPNTIFFASNYEDGLNSLCELLRKRLRSVLIHLKISIPEDMNWFLYIDSEGKERIVYSLKEDRWVFCNLGEPLSFENVDYYKHRIIKKRMNFDIISEYLLKQGIDFRNIDTEVQECMTFSRIAWDKLS